MTWTAAGSMISATSASFSVNPPAVGDLILIEVVVIADTTEATGISGGNCTWTTWAGPYSALANGGYNYTSTIFAGTATATGSATVTVTFNSGTPGSLNVAGQAFHSSVGSWALDTSGHIASNGQTTWASLTPAGAGELYWGFANDAGTAQVGSTTNYSYTVDGNGNGMAYNLSCTSSAQAPVWGDSNQVFGQMVLVKEVAAGTNVTPTSAAVKVAATAPTPSSGTAGGATPVTATIHVVATAPQPIFPASVSPPAAVVAVSAYAPAVGTGSTVSVPLAAATVVVAASPPTPYVPEPTLLPLPSINDWPVNYTPDYADLNLYIRDAFKFLTAPPLFRAQQTATHSVGGNTIVQFQDVLEDTYSGWSSGTNAYVAQVSGWYGITAMCCCTGSIVGGGFSLGPTYNLNGVTYGPIWLDLSEAGTTIWRWAFYEETFLNVGDSVQITIGTGDSGVNTSLNYPSYTEIAWLSK